MHNGRFHTRTSRSQVTAATRAVPALPADGWRPQATNAYRLTAHNDVKALSAKKASTRQRRLHVNLTETCSGLRFHELSFGEGSFYTATCIFLHACFSPVREFPEGRFYRQLRRHFEYFTKRNRNKIYSQ